MITQHKPILKDIWKDFENELFKLIINVENL